ncbi:SemiSWEET transporter [Rhizobium sp. S163]|uniref:SemiSWEET family sugar transporter n=1 Tax=Rhizobium sp. S163 TaxID=3055039 RepID=UPI000DBAB1AF|nr:SemiSWEET transporter [Rhizobium sp. S163]MDM9644874.1 SemiSWEET transporter [Rhizobium sp. S163]
MDFVSLIGYCASICSVVSFLPQALKVIRTKDTEAISTRMYVLTVTGFALWTAFGIMRGELPIILANIICFFLSAFILGAKLRGLSK